MNTQTEWTKPHCGVTHLEGIDARYWVTVSDHEEFAELSKRYPGRGFDGVKETFDTVEEAKKAGEAWLSEMKQR